MDSYVFGFYFDPEFKRVLLSRNVVTGNVLGAPGGESPDDCGVREGVARVVQKVTGWGIFIDEWHMFAKTWSTPERTAREQETESFWFWASGPMLEPGNPSWKDGSLVTSVDGVILGALKPHHPSLSWMLALARSVGRGVEACTLFEIEEAARRVA